MAIGEGVASEGDLAQSRSVFGKTESRPSRFEFRNDGRFKSDRPIWSAQWKWEKGDNERYVEIVCGDLEINVRKGKVWILKENRINVRIRRNGNTSR